MNRHSADKWADRAGSALPFFRRRLVFIFSSSSQQHRHAAGKSARRAAGPYLFKPIVPAPRPFATSAVNLFSPASTLTERRDNASLVGGRRSEVGGRRSEIPTPPLPFKIQNPKSKIPLLRVPWRPLLDGSKIIHPPAVTRRSCKTKGALYVSLMPLVFEKDGFKFAFYSNDHRPIHVHVRKGDGEAIFDVVDSKC